MRPTTRRSAVVALGAAALSIALGAGSAQADPVPTPNSNDVVGVGSDTTEFALNALAAAWNAEQTGTDPVLIGSFEATPPGTITPKVGCASIARPNGSSAGIAALQATGKDSAGRDCIDFARSSRTLTPTEDQTLDAFQFATDGLRIAVARDNDGAGSDAGTTKPASLVLDIPTLALLYRCQIDIEGPTADVDGVNEWEDLVAGGGTATPKPMLPQSGSGTRTFFLSSTGLTEADVLTEAEGGCVKEVQEHDPAPINADANSVAPFSVGRFKATVAPAGVADNGTNKPINLLGDNVPAGDNQAHFAATRGLFNVVKTTRNAELAPVFGLTGWICTDADALAAIEVSGFTPDCTP